jgi:hypothetical protein
LCKEAENKDDKEMRFAVCRRCPTSYHSKCMPRFVFSLENGDGYALDILHPPSFWLCFICVRKILFPHSYVFCSDISFEEFEDTGYPRRAWEKVLPKQILIYCMCVNSPTFFDHTLRLFVSVSNPDLMNS